MAEPEAAGAPAGGEAPPPAAEEGFDFGRVYSRVRFKDCRVSGVTLTGNQRTKDHIILRELQPTLLKAQTLEEVKDGLLDACARLNELDIFTAVDVMADKSADGPNATDILVTVTEKQVLSLHTGTYVQGEEGSLEATLRLNNALGYAETLEAHSAAGSQNSFMFALTATQQRLFGGSAAAEGRLGQTIRSFQKHSSFTEQLRGLSATLVDGRHRGEYELAWRQLSNPSRQASHAVRQQMGHSLKSSLKHSYTVDHRDSAGMATRGWALRTTSELAGVGPADLLRFCRVEAESALALPLARGVALALSLRGGVMLPWGAQPAGGRRPTHISDRFFLGGPDSLRGFCTKGVGPTDARRPPDPAAAPEERAGSITRDALGGDLLCSGAAAVTFQLPHHVLRSVGVHGHVFVNAGTVLPLSGPGAPRSVADVRDAMRAAAGAGIVFPTRIGRLEVNYCVTLRAKEHDRPKRGVQFGLRPTSL